MDQRRSVLQWPLTVHNSGQPLVVHHDQLQGIPGNVRIPSHHDGHRFAFVPGGVRRHGPPAHDLHVLADPGCGRLGGEGCVEFHAGHNRQHAGQVPGGTGVDAGNAGVGVGTTQHRQGYSANGLNVACVYSLALYQAKVFLSANRLPHRFLAAVFTCGLDGPTPGNDVSSLILIHNNVYFK